MATTIITSGSMKRYVLFLLALLASSASYGQYRCVEKGKSVFTDRPCTTPTVQTAPAPTKVMGDGNSAYATSSGAWRGQVQFMAKQGTAVVNEAHAVVPLVLEIDPQGKVTGISSETGCSFKGIAMPGIADTITTLDVTLTGCRYSGFNRQLTGRLALYRAQKYTDFSLVAYDMNRRPSGYYEIKGTLRR